MKSSLPTVVAGPTECYTQGMDEMAEFDRLAPKSLWGVIYFVLTHPQTSLLAFAAATLYLLYVTTAQHELLMKNDARIVENQAAIIKNVEALIRLEDRQINLMIKEIPEEKGREQQPRMEEMP